jgi:hypothetical protein
MVEKAKKVKKVKKEKTACCDDCWNEIPIKNLRGYKYEPGYLLCEDCLDERMREGE